MADAPLLIALVGAESTGKTALCEQLQQALSADTGLRCAVVPEYLRLWCEREGRTPAAHEQRGIAEVHLSQIHLAATQHDVVLCDTTPLMIAVYSDLLFQDRSLYELALGFHRRCDLTLLTALDIPWVADGIQRDGPHVRPPVDQAVRQALLQAGLGWSVVAGSGKARADAALNAITPLLIRRPSPRQGLLTRLLDREAAMPSLAWFCEHCDVPECEHAGLQATAARLRT